MATNRYVKQNAGGSWDVLKEGHRRSTVQAPDMQSAIDRARAAVRREGGGEVRIMNRAGKMLDSRTVTVRKAPGQSPEGAHRSNSRRAKRG